MNLIPQPSGPRYARRGANPTLETLEYIQSAVAAAGEPVSRNRLLTVLASWGHTTTRRSLNVALDFFIAIGVLGEEGDGVVWNAPATNVGRAPARRPH
ncbi:MAG: hypothetical protein L3K15_08410 [Thermoplasmata archaeon]|nr:hypothetical protein [Thermoplasmata archaeon]